MFFLSQGSIENNSLPYKGRGGLHTPPPSLDLTRGNILGIAVSLVPLS